MNDYEILSKLAEGGMAELFLARAVGHGNPRPVVLKRIARERASDTQFVQMFLDEARLAAQLRHPNIAQVFDIGRLGASYYFTMEYVHGVTVEDMIERALEHRTVLPVDAILSILFGTAAGLSHAHERVGEDGRPLGIVHRDISPSNLMVSYEGHVKVVDFGVAKAQMMGRPETQAGEIKGKVGYLSPEQCRLQKLDARSDLYSLGVVAWEMLTGKRLWKRETAFSTMAAIATEDVPAASEYREDLPPEVDALVAKLLATEVKDRFQNAREVIQAVELVGMTTRSNTSPSQLAKLMRELFGNPVEPWITAHDPVSVSTLPIPAELDTHDEDPSIDTVEHKLTSVFYLNTPPFGTEPKTQLTELPSDRFSTNSDATREIPSLARVPSLRPISRASTEIIPENLDTPVEGTEVLPQPELRGSTKMMPTEAPSPEPTIIGAPAMAPIHLPVPPPSGPVPRGSFGRMPPAGDPTVPLGTHLATGAPVVPASGPQVPPLLPASGPQVAPVDSPGPNLPRWPPPPHGDVGKLKWWIASGIVLGIVLVLLVLVLRGNDRRVTAPPPDSVVIVATTPDAPVVVAPDTAAPVIADAAIADTAEPDAAPVIADAPEPVDAAVADAPEEPKPKPKTKLRSKADLNAAFRERKYKDIVGACSELGADGDRAVVCTLAACRARAKEAQDWYRNIPPKQRDGAIRICKQSGHVIKDICATDLLACRQ